MGNVQAKGFEVGGNLGNRTPVRLLRRVLGLRTAFWHRAPMHSDH